MGSLIDLNVARAVLGLPASSAEIVLPILDEYVRLMEIG
jgi:hypothetical protein